MARITTDPTEGALEVARSSGGGWLANGLALLAIVFSGYSFYETVVKSDALTLYVSPTMDFADPSRGPFDVFVLPVTIANAGARPGVALSFDLEVTDQQGAVKRYYAAGFGSWRAAWDGPIDPFTPVSVAGREAETRQILFFPRASEEIDRHIAVEGGSYGFRLTMNRATPERSLFSDGEGPAPLVVAFDMEIDNLDYRNFQEGGTMTFRRPDYAPVVAE